MTQPVVGWRKAGLNFVDINIVREGLAAGKPLVEIQTELLNIDPKAVEACYRVYGPKPAPVFTEDPPPSLDEELGGGKSFKTKK
jgi:hypothetical protein